MIEIVWDIDPSEFNKIPEVNLTRYVYYDVNTGELKAITNSPNEHDYPFIVLTYDDVKDIFEGNEGILRYKVVFSPDQRSYVLIRKEDEVNILEQKHRFIYQVPELFTTATEPNYDLTTDVVIFKDNATTTWKFRMGSYLVKNLKDQQFYFDKNIEFYVTKHDDPNILYYTFEVPLNLLIELGHYEVAFRDLDHIVESPSIFTRKTFGKYLYIRN